MGPIEQSVTIFGSFLKLLKVAAPMAATEMHFLFNAWRNLDIAEIVPLLGKSCFNPTLCDLARVDDTRISRLLGFGRAM